MGFNLQVYRNNELCVLFRYDCLRSFVVGSPALSYGAKYNAMMIPPEVGCHIGRSFSAPPASYQTASSVVPDWPSPYNIPKYDTKKSVRKTYLGLVFIKTSFRRIHPPNNKPYTLPWTYCILSTTIRIWKDYAMKLQIVDGRMIACLWSIQIWRENCWYAYFFVFPWILYA